MKSTKAFLFAAAAIGFTLSSSTSAYYKVIDLGALPGGEFVSVESISNNGLIVGSCYPMSGNLRAVLFDPTGMGKNINLDPYGKYSCAKAVNINGQIIGYGYFGSGPMRALLFDPTGNGNNIVLGTFDGDGYGCRASSINEIGQIVGVSGNGEASKAWLYDITGNLNNLCLGQGAATSISNCGHIVGASHPISGEGWHATMFDQTGSGNNIDLGKLFQQDDRSSACSVNDYGIIVGDSGDPFNGYTATLFDPTGRGNNIALGIIGDSYAYSVNNFGQIVGVEQGHAAMFDPTGQGNNIDLNTLIALSSGWTLTRASSINDNGWIVGCGYHNGQTRAFLLIPEPASALIIVLGATPLASKRRRQ